MGGGVVSPLSAQVVQEIHPTEKNIPSDAEVDYLIGRKNEDDVGARISSLSRLISDARPVLSIGKMEGQRYEMIGRIEGLAAGESGRIYLLDSEYGEIRAYGPDGEFQFAFGRLGQGPGEFQDPEAMARDENGTLVVTDRGRRTKVLTPADTTLILEEDFTVDISANDVCAMGGRIYAQGFSEASGSVIQVYTLKGEEVGTFADPYQSTNPVARMTLSQGALECSREANTVVATFTYMPTVYGYSPDGELRWMSKLANFNMETVRGVSKGGRQGVQFRGEPGDMHMAGLTAVENGLVLLQVNQLTEEDGRPRRSTYLVDATTGEGTFVTEGIPYLYDARDDLLYAGRYFPFPQVEVLSIGN